MALFLSRIFSSLRRVLIIFTVGVVLLVTSACGPVNTTTSTGNRVPEATEAAVDRAQSNLSDQTIDEDVLSQQGESRARQTTNATVAN